MRSPVIVWKDPKSLKPHPESARIPKMPQGERQQFADDMAARGFDPAYPVVVTPDDLILDGEVRVGAAVAAGIESVPVIVQDEGDAFAFMARSALVRRHLTLGQRTLLADELRQHLSARHKSERGVKAAAAKAAANSGKAAVNVPSDTDNKQGTPSAAKPNSRKEAAATYRVPENQLKVLAEIKAREAALNVTPEKSSLRDVLAGEVELGTVLTRLQRDEQAEQQRKLRVDAEERHSRRLADAKAVTALAGLRHGDTLAELRRLRAEGEGRVRLLVLDLEPEPNADLCAVLTAAGPLLAADCVLLALTTQFGEPPVLDAVERSGLSVKPVGRLIWNIGPQGLVGTRHRPILLASRGSVQLSTVESWDESDAVEVPPDGRPPELACPVELYARLIDLASVKGEVVLFPFGGTGAGYVAAHKMGRQAICLVSDEQRYRKAVERFDLERDPVRRFKALAKPHDGDAVLAIRGAQ